MKNGEYLVTYMHEYEPRARLMSMQEILDTIACSECYAITVYRAGSLQVLAHVVDGRLYDRIAG